MCTTGLICGDNKVSLPSQQEGIYERIQWASQIRVEEYFLLNCVFVYRKANYIYDSWCRLQTWISVQGMQSVGKYFRVVSGSRSNNQEKFPYEIWVKGGVKWDREVTSWTEANM